MKYSVMHNDNGRIEQWTYRRRDLLTMSMDDWAGQVQHW